MRSGTLYRSELFSRLGVRAEGERVLDIGAFDGYWLGTQRGALRVSIDLDIQRTSSTEGIRGDALNLPFPSNAFDSVFAFEVIEHVEDDERFVAELVRVTKPGGSITLSTPSADLRIFPAFCTPWAHRRWGHERCQGYRTERLRELFAAAGVSQVEVRPLRTWSLRALYLPLSLIARASERLAGAAFRLCAIADSRWRREGPRGYLLATARRAQ